MSNTISSATSLPHMSLRFVGAFSDDHVDVSIRSFRIKMSMAVHMSTIVSILGLLSAAAGTSEKIKSKTGNR